MGTRIFVEKISKVEQKGSAYKKRSLLEKTFSLFIPDVLFDDDRFADVKPLLTRVKVIDEELDHDALSKKFADGRNVEVMGVGSCPEMGEYTFLHIDKASFGYETRRVRNEELSDCMKEQKRIYYCAKTEVIHWAEDDELRDFFRATIGGDIKNLGYYKISKEQLKTINGWLAEHNCEEVEWDDSYNGEDSGLFYHEWT